MASPGAMGELLDFLVETQASFRKARLPALFSDFRSQRTTNPDGFHANIAAWRHALANAALVGYTSSETTSPSLLVLNVDDHLLHALQSKQYGRPLALGAVIRESAHELIPLAEFVSRPDSVYQASSSWGSLPSNVLRWGLRQIGIGDPDRREDRLPQGQYVILQNVETVGKRAMDVMSKYSSRFQKAFSKAHFQKTFAGMLVPDQTLSETDIDVLLKFLSRDKDVIIYDGSTVRIKDSTTNSATITEEDSAIASLKELIEDMETQTDLLAKRIDVLEATARTAIQRKNLIAAKGALKSKKLAESSLEKRYATLNQLHEVAAKIQQAADNVQLISVMKSSTAALRSLNAETGGPEKVEEVLEHLREELGAVDEIGDIIAETGAPVIDEAELEDELEALASQENAKVEKERLHKEAEEAKRAEALEQRLSKANPPSGAVGKAGETETEAIEGMRRLSLVEQEQELAS